MNDDEVCVACVCVDPKMRGKRMGNMLIKHMLFKSQHIQPV